VDVKATVALGTLPPGAYTLQIGVTPDAGASERKARPAIQSVDFEVR